MQNLHEFLREVRDFKVISYLLWAAVPHLRPPWSRARRHSPGRRYLMLIIICPVQVKMATQGQDTQTRKPTKR